MYGETGRTGVGVGHLIVFGLILVSAIGSVLSLGSGAMFGSGVRVESTAEPAASVLAERVLAEKLAPNLSDEDLRRVYEAVLKKAESGDVAAAAFVYDLAARQRGRRPQERVATSKPATTLDPSVRATDKGRRGLR